VPLVDEHATRALRLGRAEVCRLENGPHRALGGGRMFPDELPTAREQAAEVLRPGPIRRAVDDHVSDLSGPQLLWPRREADVGIDLAVDEELEPDVGLV